MPKCTTLGWPDGMYSIANECRSHSAKGGEFAGIPCHRVLGRHPVGIGRSLCPDGQDDLTIAFRTIALFGGIGSPDGIPHALPEDHDLQPLVRGRIHPMLAAGVDQGEKFFMEGRDFRQRSNHRSRSAKCVKLGLAEFSAVPAYNPVLECFIAAARKRLLQGHLLEEGDRQYL